MAVAPPRVNDGLGEIYQHKLTRDLFALYSAHIARYLFPLITIPYLVRVLGVETWGILAFIQAYGMFVSHFIEYGFGLSGTRDVARGREYPDCLTHILSGVIGAQIFLALLVGGIAFLIYRWVPLLRNNPLVIWLGVSAAMAQGFNLLWYFRGLERMRLVATLDVLTKAVALVGIFAFVRSPEDVWKVFAAYILANCFSLTVGISIAYRKIAFRLPALHNVWKNLSQGFTLFLVRAGATLFFDGNILILGIFTSPREIGYFAGALKIITAIRGLLAPMVDVLFPRLSYLVTHSGRNAIQLIRKVFVVMIAFGFVLSLIALIGSPLLVGVILGEEFGPAISILRIFALFPLLISVSHVFGAQWMVPLGLDKPFGATIVLGAIFSLLLSTLLLTFNLTYIEVAWAMIVSQVFISGNIYFILAGKKLSPFSKQIASNFEKRPTVVNK